MARLHGTGICGISHESPVIMPLVRGTKPNVTARVPFIQIGPSDGMGFHAVKLHGLAVHQNTDAASKLVCWAAHLLQMFSIAPVLQVTFYPRKPPVAELHRPPKF